MNWRLLIAMSLGSALIACNGGENKPNIELIQDMYDQVSLKAQDWDPNSDGKGSQRIPPENTVPRGKAYVAHMGDLFTAEKKVKNPYKGDFSPEMMALGKENYRVYCLMCHGETGDGNGNVGAKMLVKPRNFLEDRVKKFTDGRMYWAIAKGYGTMGSYAVQIPTEKARWAVVNYVRDLQGQGK